MPEAKQEAIDFWSAPVATALERLGTHAEGLSSAGAAARLATQGPNRIADQPRRRLLLNFLARSRNPLILMLLAAAAVSAMTHDPTSFVIITTIVLLSVILDFVQEHRAEIAADKLRERVALRVSVLRDGRVCDVAAAVIVPGDVVMLAAGDLVPADCRLVESKDLFVNEALLTGEAYPAEKQARDLTKEEAHDVAAACPLRVHSVEKLDGKSKSLRAGLTTESGLLIKLVFTPAGSSAPVPASPTF